MSPERGQFVRGLSAQTGQTGPAWQSPLILQWLSSFLSIDAYQNMHACTHTHTHTHKHTKPVSRTTCIPVGMPCPMPDYT